MSAGASETSYERACHLVLHANRRHFVRVSLASAAPGKEQVEIQAKGDNAHDLD